jgi:hypothetical protein
MPYPRGGVVAERGTGVAFVSACLVGFRLRVWSLEFESNLVGGQQAGTLRPGRSSQVVVTMRLPRPGTLKKISPLGCCPAQHSLYVGALCVTLLASNTAPRSECTERAAPAGCAAPTQLAPPTSPVRLWTDPRLCMQSGSHSASGHASQLLVDVCQPEHAAQQETITRTAPAVCRRRGRPLLTPATAGE